VIEALFYSKQDIRKVKLIKSQNLRIYKTVCQIEKKNLIVVEIQQAPISTSLFQEKFLVGKVDAKKLR
jgi:hypothetical protein